LGGGAVGCGGWGVAAGPPPPTPQPPTPQTPIPNPQNKYYKNINRIINLKYFIKNK